MRHLRAAFLIGTCASVMLIGATRASAVTIGQWTFDALTSGQFTMNPAPSTNNQVSSTPLATPLGMNNTFTYTTSPVATGAVDGEDVLVTNGTGHTGTTDQAWRVRGDTGNLYPQPLAGSSDQSPPNDSPAVGNGWNLAAPQNSQGAKFSFNTTGYSNLVFSYDVFSTNQGVRDQQIQYTTNGGNSWTTVSATGTGAGGILGTNVAVNTGGTLYNIMTPNDFINGITVDFGALGIHSVDNNPNFGVRIASIYDPTFAGSGGLDTTYTSATIANGAYNNNSGNWRFDNVTLTGVPEPASFVLAGFGLIGIAVGGLRRRSRR
jgi:hypothetical protein